MNSITVRNVTANNLKNVTITIPLGKLVVVVGKSGSGKSSFVYDVLYRASQGESVDAEVGSLPTIFALPQRVKPVGKISLGETNLKRLQDIIEKAKKGDLLIVDEPCAGMSHEDRSYILGMLKDAVDGGISVLAVEHSKDIIANADYVIEFGPEAGAKGGEIVFQGSIEKFRKVKTPTSIYAFSNKAEIVEHTRSSHAKLRSTQGKSLVIKGITKHNFKNFNLTIPLGKLVCISGRIGTGKSTLLSVVYGAVFKGKGAWKLRDGSKSIEGKANVRRSYFIDQSLLSPISTSTPSTYLGVWAGIRDIYAALPESKKMKIGKSNFSFNTKNSKGVIGSVRKVLYKGNSIYDILDMTVDEALQLFSDKPLIVRKLGFLREVGLGYLTLGQRSNTLSGGEAQRVRLAKILSKKLGDRCVYILDTPSRGLHLSDLPVLVKVLQKIIDKNNTVLIAENREELIYNCEHLIQL